MGGNGFQRIWREIAATSKISMVRELFATTTFLLDQLYVLFSQFLEPCSILVFQYTFLLEPCKVLFVSILVLFSQMGTAYWCMFDFFFMLGSYMS